MSEQTWQAVDSLFSQTLIADDEPLEAVRAARAAGLPDIGVAPNQGKLLHLLARSVGARSVLEIGTLGGYSTIWLARALPDDGRLTTLELDPRHAEVARANVAHAGFGRIVDVRVGPALDSLAVLAGEGGPPFDFVFIDADKSNNANYFERAVALSRPGGLIVVDNVVRAGAVADASSDDPSVVGSRHLLDVAGADSRVAATAVQTVGSKGYDGFLLALVLPPGAP
jgi:predicted O-methyltransferase YrrM